MRITVATLSDLVSTLADVSGIPEATVFAYGRFAREAGLISQKGRGRGAATMTLSDAANLLIAVGGAAITRDAGQAIELFKPMAGRIYSFRLETQILNWLKPLGIRKTRTDPKLLADFGTTLGFLIDQASTGELYEFLASIPSATLSDETIRRWERRDGEILMSHRVDELLRKRGPDVEPIKARLFVRFDRSTPMALIRLERWWGVPELVSEVTFSPRRPDEVKGRFNLSDLTVVAQVSEGTLAALGLALNDVNLPGQLDFPLDLSDFVQQRRSQSAAVGGRRPGAKVRK